MKKLLMFIGGLIICSNIMASQKEDLNFLEQLYKQGQYKVAVDESLNFISKYPDSKYNKNIILRLGKTYYFEGDYNNSIRYLDMALTKDPSKSEKNDIYLYLMRSYAGLSDYEVAYKYLNAIDKSSEFYQKALLDLGNHYLETGKYIDAQNQLVELLKIEKTKYYDDAVMSLALATYNNSQYIKTTVYLDEYYKGNEKDKNYPLVCYLYGSSYYKLNEISKSKAAFKKVIDLYPESTYGKKAILTMVEISLNEKNIQLATDYLNRLKGTPEEKEAIKLFANYYVIAGKYNEAIDYYKKIIGENRSDINYGYAFSLYKANKGKEALPYCEKLKGTEYYSQGLYMMFVIRYNEKDYKWIDDNKNLLTGIKFGKDDEKVLKGILGNSFYELKDYKNARDNYVSLYSLENNKENLYKVILGEAKAGTVEDMEKSLDSYRNLYPEDKDYKKTIYLVVGERYYKDGSLLKAENLYKNYIATGENDTIILSNLVSVLLDEKKYDEVLNILNTMTPSDENVYLKGIAAMGMGKYQLANDYFQELKSKEELPKQLKEKVLFNEIKNDFLWDKYEEVIKLGQEYITSESTYGLDEIVDRVALSYFRLDNMPKAREYFDKLKLLGSYSDYAQFQIGETYYNDKEYEKAASEYEKAAEISKTENYKEKSLYWELNALYNQKNWAVYQEKSKKFLEIYPKSTFKDNVLLLNGELLAKNGDVKNQISNYEELYKNSSNKDIQSDALIKLIELNIKEKNNEKALLLVEKLTNENQKNYYESIIYGNSGDETKALEKYNILLEVPEYKDYALVKLGNYWYTKKDYNKSKKYYSEISNLDTSQYKDLATYQLASISEESNNYQEAARNFVKVYVLYPESSYALESQIKAGENFEKIKKYSEARDQYQLAYKNDKNKTYETLLLEKLIFVNLKLENKKEAEKYYNILVKTDEKSSEKYKEFIVGGTN
ncbi:MAG: tetratricopeptide repeat protein [Cetobacterium sp.]